MDFSGVREQIADKFSDQGSSDQPETSAIETEQSASQSEAPQPNQSQETKSEQAQALIDLSKVEKFKIDGEELTLEQFKQERMRQSDYTRKTQEIAAERKAIQEQQSLNDHFRADLPKILRDPSLLSEMSRHYPKEFVELAQAYLELSPTQQQQVTNQGTNLDPRTIQKYVDTAVRPLQEKFERQETETQVKQLESIFSSMKTKYPGVEDEFALARLQALDSQKIPITEQKIEEVFKYFYDKDRQGKDAYHKEQLKKQSEANRKSRDVAPGGGTPGQAPRRMKLGEVAGALKDHLTRQQT